MSVFKVNSLERFVTASLLVIGLPFAAFLGLWGWSQDISPIIIIVGEVVLLLALFRYTLHFRYRIITAFNRATLHLDAINQEDYNQQAKSAFTHGKVKEFHRQLNVLSNQLQRKKSRYDQHAFLVYQLIEQLDTPILVLNHKLQLVFGNTVFQQLFGQPWQMLRHALPTLLGLEKQEQWQFLDNEKNKQWQIRQSEFIDDGETHQLLIFVNIESALRESQLNAFQQIIRVLGHEIRNSLTPVSSLSESLADKTSNSRDKVALGVISERCQHLQEFVDRYASLSQHLKLNCQWFETGPVLDRVSALFTPDKLDFELFAERIWGDQTFIEQVIINLVKNAFEADASQIKVIIDEAEQQSRIRIIDDGHGFANLENLFIPLYTTKQQGQGIGLSFCQNVVEQHQGTIKLVNNKGQGVTVTILLPKPIH
ncbi:sensor histidine kinase [Aliikangiella coralliicola]|uniref:histidine kinase n=1 Tax=Aliikangiella coralliicola TaxID=2592383 RepID=A0A545UH83_9GAMM|nr:HAMP domain-containing sensor histidine kinase [Aliikangiella coralliicola]TQV88819.1 HAMP domain-containing histidine kinase [Aliikangiella coralliicola]